MYPVLELETALETQPEHYSASTESVYGGYTVVTAGLDMQNSLSSFRDWRKGLRQLRLLTGSSNQVLALKGN
jgi:hypothetical protein